jgi:hypothetical protein
LETTKQLELTWLGHPDLATYKGIDGPMRCESSGISSPTRYGVVAASSKGVGSLEGDDSTMRHGEQ